MSIERGRFGRHNIEARLKAIILPQKFFLLPRAAISTSRPRYRILLTHATHTPRAGSIPCSMLKALALVIPLIHCGCFSLTSMPVSHQALLTHANRSISHPTPILAAYLEHPLLACLTHPPSPPLGRKSMATPKPHYVASSYAKRSVDLTHRPQRALHFREYLQKG